jgi:hypothetical protein
MRQFLHKHRVVVAWLAISLIAIERLFHEDEINVFRGVPSNADELSSWWRSFEKDHKYPLYCIILAGNSDQETSALVQNHRTELAEVAGRMGLFVYFRDIERAKNLEPFLSGEHLKWMFPLTRAIPVDFSELPCLLFFEHLESGDYVVFKIGTKSTSEIIALVRQIFDALRVEEPDKIYSSLKQFQRAKNLKTNARHLFQKLASFGEKLALEYFLRKMNDQGNARPE